MKKTSGQKGFVILYAVLVAGVVSIGGILLANIIVKQLVLSSLGRESQFAYYAANMGDECARQAYRQGFFGFFEEGFEPGSSAYVPGNPAKFNCGEDLETTSDEDSDPQVFTFRVNSEEGRQSCADVKVWVASDVENPLLVQSTGFNYCDHPEHPRSVEKVIFRSSGGSSTD